MATVMKPTTVKNIKAYKKDYEITVRVLRKWIRESDDEDPEKRKIYGMEFILIDMEGELIQASVAKNIMRIFKPLMHEGKIYTISKFETEQNLGNDRATFHKSRLIMKFTTKVKEVNEQGIPSHAHTFYSFDDIIHGNVSNEYYIDVIGVLTTIHEVEVVKGYKRAYIDLTNDQKQGLRLTVWGLFLPEVEKIREACKTLPEKPILVLKCVQRKEWFGSVTISTTRGATRFEINPEISEVETFKNRMKENSTMLTGPIGESSKGSSILTGANIQSLATIKNIKKAGFYVTLVYIEEMDMSIHWYFNSCGKCLAKVSQEEDGLWYCKKKECKIVDIGVPKAYPSYCKNTFQARVDANDGDCVSVKLMLWDSPISKVIGKQASTILEAQEKEGDREAVPFEFRELMEREFIAKIKVDQDYNIQQQSTCYKATQLCGDKDVIKMWKELEKNSKEAELSYISSAVTISENETNTTDMQLLESMKTYTEDAQQLTRNEIQESTPISKLPKKRLAFEDNECEITEVRASTADVGSSSKSVIPLKNIKIEK